MAAERQLEAVLVAAVVGVLVHAGRKSFAGAESVAVVELEPEPEPVEDVAVEGGAAK